jgi:hypothetical protein
LCKNISPSTGNVLSPELLTNRDFAELEGIHDHFALVVIALNLAHEQNGVCGTEVPGSYTH